MASQRDIEIFNKLVTLACAHKPHGGKVLIRANIEAPIRLEVKAWAVVGPFAVHECIEPTLAGTYSISHIPSGLRLGPKAKDRREILALALLLQHLGKQAWTAIEDTPAEYSETLETACRGWKACEYEKAYDAVHDYAFNNA